MGGVRWQVIILALLLASISAIAIPCSQCAQGNTTCAATCQTCTQICTPYQAQTVTCPTIGVGWIAANTCSPDGCSWQQGSCYFDCSLCPSSTACRISSCTATSGCAYSYSVTGSSCSNGNVCDGQGNCIATCAAQGGNCGTMPTTAIAVNGYCSIGRCYKCPIGTTLSNGTCIAVCTSNCGVGQTRCVENSQQTCQLVPGTDGCYQWTTTQVCNGVCYNNQCCTPKTTTQACDQNSCATVSDSCGGTIHCNTCSNGQTCMNSQCTCPTACTYTSPCATVGHDTCGGSCSRSTEGLICGINSLCNNGQCVCTPSCTYADSCATTASNGCGGTCTRNTDGVACGSNNYCSSGSCSSQIYTITNISSTVTLHQTKKSIITPTLNVNLGKVPAVDWYATGYVTSSSFTSLVISPNVQDIGKTFTLTISAKAGGTVLATVNIQVSIVCDPGEECFCKNTATQGCMVQSNQNTPTTPVSLYCPSGICGACQPHYIYSNGVCVQCNQNADCVSTNECMTAACINNVCQNTPRSGACTGGGTCTAGTCTSTCTTEQCASLNTVQQGSLNTPTVIDCHVVTTRFITVPNYQCINQQCTNIAPRTTLVIDSNITQPEGTSCDNGAGTCQLGTCVKNECQSVADCASRQCVDSACINNKCIYTPTTNVCGNLRSLGYDVESELSHCNQYIHACGTICELQPLINHACTTNTSGICKGDGICATQCSQSPGCKPQITDAQTQHLETTAESCVATGESCYRCTTGYSYDSKTDKCIPSLYSLSVPQQEAVEGEHFVLTPILRNKETDDQLPNDGTYLYSLSTTTDHTPVTLDTTDTFTMSLRDPGIYPITIIAKRRESDAPVAQFTENLKITCAGDPCCEAGSISPKDDGTVCVKNGINGTCVARECITTCIPSVHTESGDLCNNGFDDDCNGLIDCRDPACSCKTKLRCDAGQVICSDKCVDITKNNKNCGGCGNSCSADEQCINSACTTVDQCQIICESDKDCQRGELCVNPGDCKKSYCQPSNSLVAQQNEINKITRDISETKSFTVQKEINGNKLKVHITNLAPTPLRNFTLIMNLNFPKGILKSASDLIASEPFTVIKEDPIIAFNFAQVNAEQVIIIDLPTAVDSTLVDSVNINATAAPINEQASPLTNDDLTITSNYVKENNKTTLVIRLDPHKNLAGVRVPVELPKCMLQSTQGLTATGSFEVIKDDPLVVWTFASLTNKETLEITLPKDIEDSCKDGLTAFAVADTKSRPISPWLPLIIIPIIGLVIVFFQRFHSDGGAEQKLSRKEFERLALQDGIPPEQIEEEWRQYQEKF